MRVINKGTLLLLVVICTISVSKAQFKSDTLNESSDVLFVSSDTLKEEPDLLEFIKSERIKTMRDSSGFATINMNDNPLADPIFLQKYDGTRLSFMQDINGVQTQTHYFLTTTSELTNLRSMKRFIPRFERSIMDNNNPKNVKLSIIYLKYHYVNASGKDTAGVFLKATPSIAYAPGEIVKLKLPKKLCYIEADDPVVKYYLELGDDTTKYIIKPGRKFKRAVSTKIDLITLYAITKSGKRYLTSFPFKVRDSQSLPFGYSHNADTQKADCRHPFKFQYFTAPDEMIDVQGETSPKMAQYKFNKKKYQKKAGVNLFVKYSCVGNGDRKLRKPFVIVDGISFDTKIFFDQYYFAKEYFEQRDKNGLRFMKHPITNDTYSNYLKEFGGKPNEKAGYRTINWATISTGVDAEGWVISPPDASAVQYFPDFMNRLLEKEYDIIFVDYYSGENYIENNAMALKSAIEKIYARLEGPDKERKITICGASMGGLVTRYALNMLESEGKIKWINKFISFDSPQLGANIPLGLQHFTYQMRKLSKDPYEKINCPSARQLVRYHVSGTKGKKPYESYERKCLMNDPFMTAWPSCIKIAVANGSRYRDSIQDNFDSTGYENKGYEKLIPGKLAMNTDGYLDVDLRAFPNHGNTVVISSINLFSWDRGDKLRKPLHILEKEMTGFLSLDNVPGSYRWSFRDAFTELKKLHCTPHEGALTAYAKHCFIPTLSALGIKDFEKITANNLIFPDFGPDGRYVEKPDHKLTFFDIIYAPVKNQGHIQITPENINWIMNEL